MAIPGEAGTPRSREPRAGASPPSAGAPRPAVAASLAAAAPRAAASSLTAAASPATAACSSPKLSAASARTASSAAAAWSPRARTRISSPWRTASVATPVRLRPSAGPRPRVAFETSTRASRPASAPTRRAAGRACRPSRFWTGRRSSTASPSISAGGACVRLEHLLTQLGALHRAARRAPRAPPPGATRLRAPGPPRPRRPRRAAPRESRIGPPSGSAISDAISALISALPRSIRMSTPSGERTRSTACAHPLGVGAELAALDPAGRLDGNLAPAHLPGELHDAVGQRRTVGDDDQADHGALRRGLTRGGASRRDAPRAHRSRARSASGRSPSRTPPDPVRLRRSAANSPAPTFMAMSYFSLLRP